MSVTAKKQPDKENKRRKRKHDAWRRKRAEFIYSLAGVVLLAAAIFFTWRYVNGRGMFEGTMIRTAEFETDKIGGTWCTVKRNNYDGVPLYESPGDSYTSFLLPEGKYCQGLEKTEVDGKAWVKVSYCGISGWLPGDDVNKITDLDAYIREGDTFFNNAETTKGISMYEKPDPSSKLVRNDILYGEEFEVRSFESGWAEVESLDTHETGYINMYFAGSYGTRIWKVETLSRARQINFRQEPDRDSKMLAKIPEDQVLTIDEFDHGWGLTEYDGQTGWVMLHYLTPTEK